MVDVGECGVWGTWEKLILAGAVLRHGTQSWAAVGSELRARTLHPFSFTPEACEAKYKVLQQQYFGCKALFEDLKKRRVEELRKELEKSDDSIGSLETKLKNLKAEKESYSQIDSPKTAVKVEAVESFGKDSSKDGLSAGSFTRDITKITEMDSKPEISGISDQEKTLIVKRIAETSKGSLRRKRGKRKRKECIEESKEGSNGDSENVGSANISASKRRSASLNDPSIASRGSGNEHLMGVFNSVAENDVALVFRRKLDSQKRARYRKMIKRHVDFDTLRKRIADSGVSSVKELFRDLLLLANNALVFYSKRTREYKSALSLRDTVTNSYKKHCRGASMRVSSFFSPIPELCYLPVKPRSARPRPHKKKPSTIVPVDNTDNSVDGAMKRCENPSPDDICLKTNIEVSKNVTTTSSKRSNKAKMVVKDGVKRTGNVGRGFVNGRAKATMNEKKRSRRR